MWAVRQLQSIILDNLPDQDQQFMRYYRAPMHAHTGTGLERYLVRTFAQVQGHDIIY